MIASAFIACSSAGIVLLQIKSFQVVPRRCRPYDVQDFVIVANSYHQAQCAVYDDNKQLQIQTLFDVALQNIHIRECTTSDCILSVHDYNPGIGHNMYMVRQ